MSDNSAIDLFCGAARGGLRNKGFCAEAADAIVASARERIAPIFQPFPTMEIPPGALHAFGVFNSAWRDRLTSAFQIIIWTEAELYFERFGNVPPPQGMKIKRPEWLGIIEGGKDAAPGE